MTLTKFSIQVINSTCSSYPLTVSRLSDRINKPNIYEENHFLLRKGVQITFFIYEGRLPQKNVGNLFTERSIPIKGAT